MTREDDFRHWETACHTALVATATHLGSTVFLSSRKTTILTQSRFRIEQALKAPKGIASGSIAALVRQGGEVVDAGERLRVGGGFGPFIAGQR